MALTHRSFAYEHGRVAHNERLEFLGDAILGQAVTVKLYLDNPELDEGDLAKRRASLVSSVALADIARRIGLGAHIRLGRGEELTGGRAKASILADALEAVIGAAYLSVGDAATEFVLRLVEPLLHEPERFGAAMDPKTSLQELAARLGRGLPVYTVTDSGPDHSKRFRAEVALGTGATIASGEGTSKKTAEVQAALSAFESLQARAPKHP